MSRTFRHEYSLPEPVADVDTAMYDLIEVVEASMPFRCFGLGLGNGSTGDVYYVFFSTRAKGRRIVAQINDRLGVTGTVEVDLPAEWLARTDAHSTVLQWSGCI